MNGILEERRTQNKRTFQWNLSKPTKDKDVYLENCLIKANLRFRLLSYLRPNWQGRKSIRNTVYFVKRRICWGFCVWKTCFKRVSCGRESTLLLFPPNLKALGLYCVYLFLFQIFPLIYSWLYLHISLNMLCYSWKGLL